MGVMANEVALPKNLVAHQNKEGLIELIDVHTGQVVSVQHSIRDIMKGKQARVREVTLESGQKVLLENTLSVNAVARVREYIPDPLLVDLLAQAISDGATITEACEAYNFKNSALTLWRTHHPEIDEKIKLAIKRRASRLVEQVLEEAKESGDTKVRIDAYKYVAEKTDPENYGNRTKIVGDPNAPLGFVLETGIRRNGDPGFQGGTDAAQNHLESGRDQTSLQSEPEDAVLVVEAEPKRDGIPHNDGARENVEDIALSVDDIVRAD